MTASPGASDPEPPTETAAAAHWPQMTGQAVSDFLGFTPQWLKKLEQQGFVDRLDNKLFDAGAVCLGYIRWLKDDARRNNKTEGAKRTEAAKALKVEIENAKALHEVADFETIELTFVEMFTTLSSEVFSVPAAFTRDLPQRAALETLINGAFDRCRQTFDATIAALRSGAPVLDAEEDGES